MCPVYLHALHRFFVENNSSTSPEILPLPASHTARRLLAPVGSRRRGTESRACEISLHCGAVPHLLTLSETWLTGDVSNAQIEIQGYSLHRLDRLSHGGGTAVYIPSHMKAKRRKDLEICGIET